jgi:hypothetical protein
MKVVPFFKTRGPLANLRSVQAAFFAAALALLVASTAAPQNPPAQGSSGDSDTNTSKISPSAEKVKLIEATRVSTEEAGRRAAQDKAKGTSKTIAKKKSENDSAPGVSELRPVSKPAGDSAVTTRVPADESGKSVLKNIHGSVQGASGAGTRRAAAEVGASSKTGKTHVYVETERSRSDPATPH